MTSTDRRCHRAGNVRENQDRHDRGAEAAFRDLPDDEDGVHDMRRQDRPGSGNARSVVQAIRASRS
jgi:hypothetical protein